MGWVRNFGLGEKFWVVGKILGWHKILKPTKSWQIFFNHLKKSWQKVVIK